MMLDPRHGAENLFRPPDAVAGSDAEKLQKLRERLQLRKRELRLQEKQSRDDTRQERIAASRIPVDAKRTPTADGLSPRSGFWK